MVEDRQFGSELRSVIYRLWSSTLFNHSDEGSPDSLINRALSSDSRKVTSASTYNIETPGVCGAISQGHSSARCFVRDSTLKPIVYSHNQTMENCQSGYELRDLKYDIRMPDVVFSYWKTCIGFPISRNVRLFAS